MTTQGKKRPSGCYYVFLIFVLIALAVSVATNLGLMAGLAGKAAGLAQSGDFAEDEFPQFTEHWSYGQGEVVVARIPLIGIISRESSAGFLMPIIDPVQSVLNQIRAARNDEAVRAIFLEVDSPGGAVTPSDEIYNALLRFRESGEGRRVIVYTRDMAASGGYYAAVAGDWIIAEPTAVIGSIGVLIQAFNWYQLSERIGISDVTVKSGENKDLLNPFRPTDPLELGILQALVDSMYDRFVGAVKTGRHLDDADMERLADGRVFSSDEALKEQLIDEVGYFEDAVARTADLLGVSSIRMIRYEQRLDFYTWLASIRHPLAPLEAATQINHPRLMYLWRP